MQTIIPQVELKAEVLHQAMLTSLCQHLPLPLKGYRCSQAVAYNVLLKALATGSSLEAVCADWSEGVAGNSLREQLNRVLDEAELRLHEARMNHALQSNIPTAVPRGGLEVALDYHDEPFYGQTPALRTYTCKAQAKAGTSHFFRIASAYVIWREVRLTLAVTYVLPEDSAVQVVERLLNQLQRCGLHATVLYLDKGFCSGIVIRHLQARRQAAILACPIRGKQGGIRALCRGRSSYVTHYTFADGTAVRLALVATLVKDKSRRKRRKWVAFVLVEVHWSPQQVYQKYRRRFGIEGSYRMLRQVKVMTNSRNAALRFFLLGLGLVVQNTWVVFRYACCRRPARGRAKFIPALLRFDRFRKLLVRAIELICLPPFRLFVYALPNP
jgi:hypothetical protein